MSERDLDPELNTRNLTDPELDALLALEVGPRRQFWLSFVDPSKGEGGFLGACIVEADGPLTAIQLTHLLGLNPGGEVAVWDLRDYEYPEHLMYRLLPACEAWNANMEEEQ